MGVSKGLFREGATVGRETVNCLRYSGTEAREIPVTTELLRGTHDLGDKGFRTDAWKLRVSFDSVPAVELLVVLADGYRVAYELETTDRKSVITDPLEWVYYSYSLGGALLAGLDVARSAVVDFAPGMVIAENLHDLDFEIIARDIMYLLMQENEGE